MNFDKSLILLEECERGQQVKNISFKEASFWVRVYDLPLMARNEYIGHVNGGAMGRVEEMDLDDGEVK